MLKIAVCVKAVPDPDEADKIKIDPTTRMLVRVDVSLVINPLDKCALEAALQLKEKAGAEITVVSMGPPPAENIVKECLALGADHGYLLCDQAFAGADAFATAFTLACAIRKLGPFDVVFCGRGSSDGATEWVGPEVATFLDWPVVTMVKELLECTKEDWVVKANLENGYRLIKVKLPAVFTVTRELNTPRALSFSGILKARNKEITEWAIQDLGVPEDEVGLKGSPTVVSEMTHIERKRECEFIEGTMGEKAQMLIQKLVEGGVL